MLIVPNHTLAASVSSELLLWIFLFAFMQPHIIKIYKLSLNFGNISEGHFDHKTFSIVHGLLPGKSCSSPCIVRARIPSIFRNLDLEFKRIGFTINNVVIRALADKSLGDSVDEEDDDDLCPVDCVQEFKTDEEFLSILEKAKKTNSLVVVDFYRTSCGSCKYIERAFSKLCKGSGDEEAPVIFLKHNVMDEYDEQSEVAERLRIRVVPLFHFYKNGVLLEAFPTRDKEKIIEAIHRYTS